MKNRIVFMTLVAILSTARAASAANTLTEMTMSERLQDLQAIATRAVDGVLPLESVEISTDDFGHDTLCLNIGSALTSLRILRTLTAGILTEEAKLDDYAKQIVSIKNKNCSH